MKQSVNMMPDEYFATVIVRKRIAAWVAIAVLAVVGSMALSYPATVRAKHKLSVLEPLRQNVASMEKWGERIPSVTTSLRAARTQQQAVSELLNEPFWNGLLADMAAATNGELCITQLDITKHVIDAGGKNKKTEIPVVTISGMAPGNAEVIQFMQRLSGSEHLKSLELEASRASSKGREEGLTLEFTIQGVAQ